MSFENNVESSDASVQETNHDATSAKASAVSLGYWKDPYVGMFVKRIDRKQPLIHRGYYARVAGIQSLLIQYLQISSESEKQVLLLGAGFDTLYWTLGLKTKAIHWYEVDFEAITQKKCAIIHKHVELKSGLVDIPEGWKPGEKIAGYNNDGNQIHTAKYHLIHGDLREWDQVVNSLIRNGFDVKKPTMILTECVLVYLFPEHSKAIIDWCGHNLATSLFVNYEIINPYDAFGQTMIKNLNLRKCPLLGIYNTPTLNSQKQRFSDADYTNSHAISMDKIYSQLLSGEEKLRIEKIEWLDEVEEWDMILAHYCISWAAKDAKKQMNGILDLTIRPISLSSTPIIQ